MPEISSSTQNSSLFDSLRHCRKGYVANRWDSHWILLSSFISEIFPFSALQSSSCWGKDNIWTLIRKVHQILHPDLITLMWNSQIWVLLFVWSSHKWAASLGLFFLVWLWIAFFFLSFRRILWTFFLLFTVHKRTLWGISGHRGWMGRRVFRVIGFGEEWFDLREHAEI